MCVTWIFGSYKLGKSRIVDQELLPRIRARYDEGAKNITDLNETWKSQGFSAKERSKMAFIEREKIMDETRGMMTEQFSKDSIQLREFLKYGNPKGATYDQLVAKNIEKGLRGEAVYEAIIVSASRTNASVNATLLPKK